MLEAQSTRQSGHVQEYYGKVLQGSKDLKTSACCSIDTLSPAIKRIMAEIEPEILDRFYGCGTPLPAALKGCTVLDLGCGTGRDAYVASYLTGASGYVIGVDMTEEQLEVALRYRESQARKFGYPAPNTDFRHGYIEDLKEAEIEDESVDVVISNCVINLSPDKPRVFEEIWRVLKPGGELYFSDIFTDRRLPNDLCNDPVLLGECLAGALYWEDFRRIMARLGFLDLRIVSHKPVQINDEHIERMLGAARFESITVRAFKLATLEDRCEDYGQTGAYLGTVAGMPNRFILDNHHIFETDKPMLICGNTADMLSRTRFKPYFRVTGNREKHFGVMPCSGELPFGSSADTAAGCC